MCLRARARAGNAPTRNESGLYSICGLVAFLHRVPPEVPGTEESMIGGNASCLLLHMLHHSSTPAGCEMQTSVRQWFLRSCDTIFALDFYVYSYTLSNNSNQFTY